MPWWQPAQARARQQPPAEEPFELFCACGRSVVGLRRASAQRVNCKQCGTLLFVLPLDTYPAPVARTSSKKKRRQSDAAALPPSESDWSRLGQLFHKSAEGVRAKSKAVGQRVRQRGVRVARGTAAQFTPLRLVMLATVVFGAGTAYWMLHNRNVSRAEETLKIARREGQEALQKGDFTVAATKFAEAVKALDVTKADTPDARSVRQLARESTAGSQLAPLSLFEMIREMEQVHKDKSQTVPDAFRARYRDRWIVIDTTVAQVPNPDGTRSIAIDYPLVAGGRPIVIEAGTAAFDRLPDSDKARRSIFAAQLDSCRLVGGSPDQWIISVRPETVFLWSNLDNLKSLGFTIDQFHLEKPVVDVLHEQSRLLGIEP